VDFIQTVAKSQPPMITSTQNEKIKRVHALQNQTKARRKEQRIVLEGVRLVRDAVESGHRPEFVLNTPDAPPELLQLISRRNADLLLVSEDVMRHVSDTENPQSVLGVFPTPEPAMPDTPTAILILDAIRDPGNLGGILRTAAAAGVQAVILSPDCADPYNPKALRGGMGAHFRIPVIDNATWEEIREYCRDLSVYLADYPGDIPYNEADWSSPWALIIGSEAHGASPDAEQLATQRLFIPMAADTESLNAGVAAGVILFEAWRRTE
jgi:RNA methyltransferase, TrmH family